MEYILIERIHDEIDEPNKVYSEIDQNRMETRRVEFFPTGLCFAYGEEHGHDEVLSKTPFPTNLRELETDEDTKARTVPHSIFREVWEHAAETPDNLMNMFF